MPTKKFENQTLGEEIANAVSHGIGSALAIAGTVIIMIFALQKESGTHILCGIIYGLSLIVLYASSTLYHSICEIKAKYVFRILDHCNIFLLISGTYTPISVLMIGGKLGYSLLLVNTICGVLGIILNAINMKKFKKFSMVLYIVMGWMCILIGKPLINAIPLNIFWFLLSGGIAYTVGIIFFACKRLRYMHFIWHLFVLLGSILHFIFIFLGCYL